MDVCNIDFQIDLMIVVFNERIRARVNIVDIVADIEDRLIMIERSPKTEYSCRLEVSLSEYLRKIKRIHRDTLYPRVRKIDGRI